MADLMPIATAGQHHLRITYGLFVLHIIEAHLHVYQLSKCGQKKPVTGVAVPVLSSHAVLLGLRHRRDVSIAEFTALPLKKAVLV